MSQSFDEVWLAPEMTLRLPLPASPLRGLFVDLVDIFSRRGVVVLAGGTALPEQLDGAVSLGLAGAFGPLFDGNGPPVVIRMARGLETSEPL